MEGLGTAPPLSPIDQRDHAGVLWIVAILMTIYVSLSAVVRALIKWKVYGADDYLLFTATIVCFGQSAAVFHGLNHGLAKYNSITTEREWRNAGKSFFASEILAVIALGLAKCSVVCLMHRVFTGHLRWQSMLYIASMAISIAWMIGSAAAIGANCHAETLLMNSDSRDCPAQISRWRIVTILDILTDTLLCLLPIALTWTLQMPLKMKSQVIIAFGLRLPILAFAALHFSALDQYVASTEPLYAITTPLLYQQAMLFWSLLSATIPNLKTFMKSFSTEFGLLVGLGGVTTGNSNSRAYPLKNLTIGSARTRDSSKKQRGGESLMNTMNATMKDGDDDDMHPITAAETIGDPAPSSLRPDPHMHEATVVGNTIGAEDEGSIGSHGSQDLIIRKEVNWHVRVESSGRGEEDAGSAGASRV